MDLGPYYPDLTASDRLRVLVEELRWEGPTKEILRELGCFAEELEVNRLRASKLQCAKELASAHTFGRRHKCL